MNRALGHFCAHIYIGRDETYVDADVNFNIIRPTRALRCAVKFSRVHIQYCSFETCGEFTGNIHMNSPQENSPWGIPLGESDSLPQANW